MYVQAMIRPTDSYKYTCTTGLEEGGAGGGGGDDSENPCVCSPFDTIAMASTRQWLKGVCEPGDGMTTPAPSLPRSRCMETRERSPAFTLEDIPTKAFLQTGRSPTKHLGSATISIDD